MFIITGMHRSGTSLVARLFYEAGTDMGDPKTFYRPDRWNPEGYFEQPDIHAINMPLVNGPWWKLAYFRLPPTNTILRRAAKYAEQIEKIGARYKEKVVKETRFCLTLPAWLAHGVQVDRILICLRDPVQVARSIQKRNSTTLGHGYYLWRIHNERILENAGDIPVWFVYYDDVMNEASYLREAGAACRFFGFDFTDRQLTDLRQRCVRPAMNHHPQKSASYPAGVAALWRELCQRHGAQFT